MGVWICVFDLWFVLRVVRLRFCWVVAFDLFTCGFSVLCCDNASLFILLCWLSLCYWLCCGCVGYVIGRLFVVACLLFLILDCFNCC